MSDFIQTNITVSNAGIYPQKKVAKGKGVITDKDGKPVYLDGKEMSGIITKETSEKLIEVFGEELANKMFFYNEEKDIYYFSVKAKNKLKIYDTSNELVAEFEKLNVPIKDKEEKAIDFHAPEGVDVVINIVRLFNEDEQVNYTRLNAIQIDMVYVKENPTFTYEPNTNPFA